MPAALVHSCFVQWQEIRKKRSGESSSMRATHESCIVIVTKQDFQTIESISSNCYIWLRTVVSLFSQNCSDEKPAWIGDSIFIRAPLERLAVSCSSHCACTTPFLFLFSESIFLLLSNRRETMDKDQNKLKLNWKCVHSQWCYHIAKSVNQKNIPRRTQNRIDLLLKLELTFLVYEKTIKDDEFLETFNKQQSHSRKKPLAEVPVNIDEVESGWILEDYLYVSFLFKKNWQLVHIQKCFHEWTNAGSPYRRVPRHRLLMPAHQRAAFQWISLIARLTLCFLMLV